MSKKIEALGFCCSDVVFGSARYQSGFNLLAIPSDGFLDICDYMGKWDDLCGGDSEAIEAFEWFCDRKDVVFINGDTISEALESAYDRYVEITGNDWIAEQEARDRVGEISQERLTLDNMLECGVIDCRQHGTAVMKLTRFEKNNE